MNGEIVGTPVDPEDAEMNTTSSSLVHAICPRKLPLCCVSRSVFLLING